MQGNVYSWLIRVIGNEKDPTRVKIKLNDDQIAFKTYCDGVLINGFSIEGKVTGSNFGIGIQVKDGTNAILGASMIYKDLSTAIEVVNNSFCFSNNANIQNSLKGINAISSVVDCKNSIFKECEYAVVSVNRSSVITDNSELINCGTGLYAKNVSMQ